MKNSILQYRSTVARNSETFLLNFSEEFSAFTETDSKLYEIGVFMSSNRTKNGESLVGFLPYMLIMQRQLRNAFQLLSTYQSYQTWVLARPFFESSLIMGKWLDDGKNFEIWKKQKENWKAYNQCYSGKKLISNSLPNSSDIQGVLKKINDIYMHVNPQYFFNNHFLKGLENEEVLLTVPFTDEPNYHEANLYSFLHVTLFVVGSVGEMLKNQYGQNKVFNINLSGLQIVFKEKIKQLVKSDSESKKMLIEYGLWPENYLI